MTLNEQAALIANTLNQPFNHELKERIKDLYKQQMALYIRRSLKEHGIDEGLTISYNAELIKVEKNAAPAPNKYKDYILRTKHRVPSPIRYPGDSPFTYVGTIDGSISFPMRNQVEDIIMHSYSSTGGSSSYRKENGYIYINHKPNFTSKLQYIKVQGIFENPDEVLSMYEDVDGQDLQLPFPADIAAMIQGSVLQLIGSVPPDNITVNQSDDRIANEE